MSDNAPRGAAPPSIEQQIEALTRLSDDLHRSLARGRTVRLILLLAFVALAAVTLAAFYRLGNKVRSEEYLQQVQGLAQQRLEKNTDRYVRELELLTADAGPVLRDAFAKQSDQDSQLFLKAMEAESDKFSASIKEQLVVRVEGHSRKAVERHRAILRAEFPLVKDEQAMQRMTDNLGVAMERAARKYYVDQTNDQLNALYAGWSKFPAAPAPGKNDPPLNDQLIGDLLELLTHRLTQPDAMARR
jgi:hypothetical protein